VIVRKGLHGVTAETRLPGAAYTPEVSEAVYSEAARALSAGCSVIIEAAVFDRAAECAHIEALATGRTSRLIVAHEHPPRPHRRALERPFGRDSRRPPRTG
jgi:predicted kinase